MLFKIRWVECNFVLGMTLNCIHTMWYQGMTLNCIHIFIVTGSILYRYVMRLASQRFFIHSCIYLRILLVSYLATFLGTNSLSVLMCRIAVNQSSVILFCRKFAPRCCVCSLPMMPSPGEDEAIRIVVLDRSFHVNCFRCEVMFM